MSITKGPWYHGDGGIFGGWDDMAQERTLVAEVVRCGMNGPHTEEGRLNANLIAAAPELLEALKELSESVERLRASGDAGDWEPEDDPYYMKALKAIAKAEGRE